MDVANDPRQRALAIRHYRPEPPRAVLLGLFGMLLLADSMMTMPGDGAQPGFKGKTLTLGALIIAPPLMLIAAAGLAITGIRSGRTVLANQIICGLAVALLLLGAWLAGIFSLSSLS